MSSSLPGDGLGTRDEVSDATATTGSSSRMLTNSSCSNPGSVATGVATILFGIFQKWNDEVVLIRFRRHGFVDSAGVHFEAGTLPRPSTMCPSQRETMMSSHAMDQYQKIN